MHNSAFYPPLAALGVATFPLMSRHNKRFKKHPALIAQNGHLTFAFSHSEWTHTLLHTYKTADRGCITQWNHYFFGTKNNSCTYINAHTPTQCSNGSGDAELNDLFFSTPQISLLLWFKTLSFGLDSKTSSASGKKNTQDGTQATQLYTKAKKVHSSKWTGRNGSYVFTVWEQVY